MTVKSKWLASLAICLAATMSVGFMSCGDDDAPQPEIIENPLDVEAYYISGKVIQASGALEGVKVSTTGVEAKSAADGTFQLEVTKKGDYVVSFAKDGYIGVSTDVEIAKDVKKRSSVAVRQELTKTNAPVTIIPNAAASVSGGEKSPATLEFPVGAVTKATDVTVTEYQTGVKKLDTRAGLSTINCQPDGLKFEKPVTVVMKNMMSSAIYFADVAHFVEKAGAWVKEGAVSYDPNANVYATELTGFSNHSFGPAYAATSKGSSSEDLGEVSIDNLGSMASKEGAVSGKQKFGWTIDGDLSALLKAQFSALTATDLEGLVAVINGAIASTKGSAAGVSESTLSMGTAKVSGDTKMTVKFSAVVKATAGTFNFIYQGKATSISIPVKTYNGLATTITYQYGASHTDHSGGGGK